MLYAFICTDKRPEGPALRQANRSDHLAWLESLGDTMKIAGPFMSENGKEPRGSLVIVTAESLDAARAIAAGDPYAKGGVFESVEVRPFKWLLGNRQAEAEAEAG